MADAEQRTADPYLTSAFTDAALTGIIYGVTLLYLDDAPIAVTTLMNTRAWLLVGIPAAAMFSFDYYRPRVVGDLYATLFPIVPPSAVAFSLGAMAAYALVAGSERTLLGGAVVGALSLTVAAVWRKVESWALFAL